VLDIPNFGICFITDGVPLLVFKDSAGFIGDACFQGAGEMNIEKFEKECEIWQKSNPMRIKEREYWLDEEIAKIPR
jgi:hypothetical protein